MKNEKNASSIDSNDWTSWRAQKWKDQLDAMQSTLAKVDNALLAHLDLGEPLCIADIGCGGGTTTQLVANAAAQGSTVEGLDISSLLVEVAQGRRAQPGVQTTYEVTDVEQDEGQRGPYDLLISRFGVMFFRDPERAFTNLVRWMRPQAKFLFAVWGVAKDCPAIASIRKVIESRIDLPAPKVDGPGPFRYGDPTKLLSALSNAGLGDLEVKEKTFSLPVGGGVGAKGAAEFALSSYSNYAELLAKKDPEIAREVKAKVIDHYTQFEKGGVVQMDAKVLFVGGRRGS